MAIYKDLDGNRWEDHGENKFSQRLIRCIEGTRVGEVILNPHCDAPPETKERPSAERLSKSEVQFYRDLYSKAFWDRD